MKKSRVLVDFKEKGLTNAGRFFIIISKAERGTMPELILHLQNLKAACTNCGELVDISGELQIEQSGIIDCPKCGAQFLIGVLVQIFSQLQLKSNYRELLGVIGVEKEIEDYLDELANEPEPVEGQGDVIPIRQP